MKAPKHLFPHDGMYYVTIDNTEFASFFLVTQGELRGVSITPIADPAGCLLMLGDPRVHLECVKPAPEGAIHVDPRTTR